jgi:hypothetical protein
MNYTTPTLTHISDELIPGYPSYMEFGWIWEMPIFPTVGDMRKTNVGGYPVG